MFLLEWLPLEISSGFYLSVPGTLESHQTQWPITLEPQWTGPHFKSLPGKTFPRSESGEQPDKTQPLGVLHRPWQEGYGPKTESHFYTSRAQPLRPSQHSRAPPHPGCLFARVELNWLFSGRYRAGEREEQRKGFGLEMQDAQTILEGLCFCDDSSCESWQDNVWPRRQGSPPPSLFGIPQGCTQW